MPPAGVVCGLERRIGQRKRHLRVVAVGLWPVVVVAMHLGEVMVLEAGVELLQEVVSSSGKSNGANRPSAVRNVATNAFLTRLAASVGAELRPQATTAVVISRTQFGAWAIRARPTPVSSASSPTPWPCRQPER